MGLRTDSSPSCEKKQAVGKLERSKGTQHFATGTCLVDRHLNGEVRQRTRDPLGRLSREVPRVLAELLNGSENLSGDGEDGGREELEDAELERDRGEDDETHDTRVGEVLDENGS